jgi:hypothetical protein
MTGSSVETDLVPALDDKQVGHLRHLRNLLSQPDGDWVHMTGDDPRNMNDHIAPRYQLSQFVYNLAVAHYHRLPAAPGFFRDDIDAAIRKMQRHDVWNYWYGLSRSNTFFDPSLTEPREPWWDPVAEENIMYSGHVTAMAAVYDYLFDDDKYEQPGALKFRPSFEGVFEVGSWADLMQSTTASEYDLESLNDIIYWQMVANGYMGVACEPNLVFTTCNQFPVWGFRWHDVRKGTDRAGEVIAGHEQAWQRYGGYQPGRLSPNAWRPKQDDFLLTTTTWGYWALTAWNGDYVRSMYELWKAGTLRRLAEGGIEIIPNSQATAARDAFEAGQAPPPVDRATADLRTAGVVGWASMLMAEVGDPDLEALLDHVDAHMQPTWERGGLFYPRNDRLYDDDGHFVAVQPTAGNGNYGYSRLTVENGLADLFGTPLTREHFESPQLTGANRDLDVLRARWLDDRGALVLTVRPWGDPVPDAALSLTNVVGRGDWSVSIDGVEIGASDDRLQTIDDRLELHLPVQRAVDVVVRRT